MRTFILAAAAFALLATPACTLFQDPANIAGVTKEEANEVRLIKASLTVSGAYAVLGQQLDKGLVTKAEATRIKTEIDKVGEAVKVAATALEIGDGTAEQKLLYLQNLVDALARERLLKG